jgi:hypothetical protein
MGLGAKGVAILAAPQYFFSSPDCGTDSLSSEIFFTLHAGRTVTRWCGKCRSLFDAAVPQPKADPPS